MNCFQIVPSHWSSTVDSHQCQCEQQLWIAFKLYLRIGLQQLGWTRAAPDGCCELLSNCTFALVFNSKKMIDAVGIVVVNCFQIVPSHWSSTVLRENCNSCEWLWIAFKLYLRIGLQQFPYYFDKQEAGCELLSNCTFALVFNSYLLQLVQAFAVVNCFQIVPSHWSSTVIPISFPDAGTLWIAFKLYLRIGLQQLVSNFQVRETCCELLSNCTFALVFNSRLYRINCLDAVVNCFQIVPSHWSSTVRMSIQSMTGLLWIAFKLYLRIGL